MKSCKIDFTDFTIFGNMYHSGARVTLTASVWDIDTLDMVSKVHAITYVKRDGEKVFTINGEPADERAVRLIFKQAEKTTARIMQGDA